MHGYQTPRIVALIFIVALAVTTETGCSQPPSSTSAAIAKAGRFVYVANANHGGLQGSISGFAMNGGSSLTPIAGSPYAAGTNTTALAKDAANKVLYAANVNGLSGYLISTGDGTLQAIAGSPFDSANSFRSVAVTPPALFVYAVNQLTGSVSGFRVGSNGALTGPVLNSPFQTATPTDSSNVPTAVRVDPSGRFLYTANGSDGIFVFTISSADGALSFVDNVKANGSSHPYDLAFTPDGRFVFAPNAATSGGVDAYSINTSTGGLTLISGSPFATNGNEPLGAAVDSSGTLLFVVNFISNSISVFAIGTGGTLTAVGTPAATDSNPIAVAVDPSGSFACVANLGAGTVNVFTIGPGGALALVSTTATGQVRLFDIAVSN